MSDQNARVVFLRGRRVEMRPLLEQDIPLLVRWMNDREVTHNLTACFPVQEQHEREWLESLHKQKGSKVVLMMVVDEGPIGVMGLHRINWVDQTAVTGAFIGEKDMWGKGYGSEAKMLLLEYAFNTLGLRKVCSTVIEFNARSLGYNRKCGYVVEGRRVNQFYRNGRYWDEIQLAVFRESWLQLREASREQSLSVTTTPEDEA